MQSEIMLSIAMVTYNHGNYIRHALNSILEQETRYSYEIIIGDDCSSDDTQLILQEYVQKYPDRIKAICRKENLGPTRNTYDVLTRCKGKYLAFLDGDDYYTDSMKIEKQVGFLEANPKYKSCAHRLEIVDKNEKHLIYTLSDLPLNSPMNGKDFMRYNTDMLHVNSLVCLNVIKDDIEKYKIIYESNKWSCHSMFLLICLQMSDIYVFSDSMTVWRSVNEAGASNYTSRVSEKKLLFMEEKMRLYQAEKLFFKDTVSGVNFSWVLAKGYLACLDVIDKTAPQDRKMWEKKYQSFLSPFESRVVVPMCDLYEKADIFRRKIRSIVKSIVKGE